MPTVQYVNKSIKSLLKTTVEIKILDSSSIQVVEKRSNTKWFIIIMLFEYRTNLYGILMVASI